MKLRKEFITYETEKESLLVPAGNAEFSGLVKGNKTFGAILEYLKEDTTEDEIVKSMKEQYDAPEEDIAKDVRHAISELRRIGALNE